MSPIWWIVPSGCLRFSLRGQPCCLPSCRSPRGVKFYSFKTVAKSEILVKMRLRITSVENFNKRRFCSCSKLHVNISHRRWKHQLKLMQKIYWQNSVAKCRQTEWMFMDFNSNSNWIESSTVQGVIVRSARPIWNKYSQLSLTDTWCWSRPFLSYFTITKLSIRWTLP